MITEYLCYKIRCEKCGHSWVTKTHEIPVRCAKCNSVKWNEGCPPMMPKIIEPAQPIADERKSVLTALQAKIDGIQSGSIAPKVETVEDHWIELPTTRENGDILYWHRKIKGAPVCYHRETNWDSFA